MVKVFYALLFLQILTPNIAVSVEVPSVRQIITKSATPNTAFLGQGKDTFGLDLPWVNIVIDNGSTGIQKTGVIYQLPIPINASELTWEQVNGGYVARIRVVSSQAERLRYHLVFSQPVPAMSFRVKGELNAMPHKAIDQTFIHKNSIWLPITDGSVSELEVFVKGNKPDNGIFVVDAVNIIALKGRKASEKEKLNRLLGIQPKDFGGAQFEQNDLTCWNNNSVPNYEQLDLAASATAKINIPVDAFTSGSCTGVLLNDTKTSFTPWFATASHCVSDQETANNLAFEWYWQADSCGSFFTDNRYEQTAGGADLLYVNKKNDFSLLRLRQMPQGGVAFVGWDDKKFGKGRKVWGVHHPQGDFTKVSLGKKNKTVQYVSSDSGIKRQVDRVFYSSGGVEQGSSGSGLFVENKKGVLYFIGTLSAVARNNYQIADYSSLNRAYPKIKRWLAAAKSRR